MLAIAVIALGVVSATSRQVHLSSSSVAVLLVGVGLLVAALWPGAVADLARRLSGVKGPGFELTLAADARALVITRYAVADEDGVAARARPTTGTPVDQFDAVRGDLTSGLAWIASRLVPDDRNATTESPWLVAFYGQLLRHATDDAIGLLGLLRAERLLRNQAVRVSEDILRLPAEEFESWPASVRDDVLEAGWTVSARLKSEVFDQIVRRMLVEAGFPVVDFPQRRGHRADFLACSSTGEWARLTARQATDKDSKLLADTTKRLARPAPSRADIVPNVRITRRIVVIPDRTAAASSWASDPMVVRIGHLPTALRGEPEPAGHRPPATAGASRG
jgi:hypothetical protein